MPKMFCTKCNSLEIAQKSHSTPALTPRKLCQAIAAWTMLFKQCEADVMKSFKGIDWRCARQLQHRALEGETTALMKRQGRQMHRQRLGDEQGKGRGQMWRQRQRQQAAHAADLLARHSLCNTHVGQDCSACTGSSSHGFQPCASTAHSRRRTICDRTCTPDTQLNIQDPGCWRNPLKLVTECKCQQQFHCRLSVLLNIPCSVI